MPLRWIFIFVETDIFSRAKRMKGCGMRPNGNVKRNRIVVIGATLRIQFLEGTNPPVFQTEPSSQVSLPYCLPLTLSSPFLADLSRHFFHLSSPVVFQVPERNRTSGWSVSVNRASSHRSLDVLTWRGLLAEQARRDLISREIENERGARRARPLIFPPEKRPRRVNTDRSWLSADCADQLVTDVGETPQLVCSSVRFESLSITQSVRLK